MKREGKTRREAAEEWVKGFNAIPTRMIYELWQVNPEDWIEVTCPEAGDRVYAYNKGSGEIVDMDYENNRCMIEQDNGNTLWLDEAQIEVEHDNHLPM